jgi:hypothetical protein
VSLLLSGAKRIEAAAGARAGLHAYRALAERGPSLDAATAHLAAMRCAAELGDDPAFHKLLLSWPQQPGAHAERITALAHRLALQDKQNLARILLEAERTRWSEGERTSPAASTALYLAAALAPGEGRAELLRKLATTSKDARLAGKASLRLAELARARGQTAAAADMAREIGVTDAAERIRRAEILLLSGSRFQRAAAFSELAELVPHDEAGAIRAAIRGLCCVLPVLTPLEEDRVRAVFARLPDEPKRERWLAFVDACCRRARDPEDAPDEGEAGARSALDLQWLHVTLHDLVARLREAAPTERAPLERRFAELIAMGAAPARGFYAFSRVVTDPVLRRDLVLRAEAAGEPHARQALLDLVHAEADLRLQAGDVASAYRLTETVVLARRSGDFAAIRAALVSPTALSR